MAAYLVGRSSSVPLRNGPAQGLRMELPEAATRSSGQGHPGRRRRKWGWRLPLLAKPERVLQLGPKEAHDQADHRGMQQVADLMMRIGLVAADRVPSCDQLTRPFATHDNSTYSAILPSGPHAASPQ